MTASLGLPKDVASWKNHVWQLGKYDDKLAGWWTPNEQIAKHDVIASFRSTGRSSSPIRWKRLRKTKAGNSKEISPSSVSSNRAVVKDFLVLKKERGDLSVKPLSERLRESRASPTTC